MVAHTTGTVTIDGGLLVYETTGDPFLPALVMIHAGVATLDMWEPQIAALSDRWYCVAYDVRGYGRTDSENGTFSNRRDLLALLDHLHIDRAVVMGCSRGGTIALDFALENPTRVRALILSGAGLSGFDSGEGTPDESAAFEALEKAFDAQRWEEVEEMELHFWYDGLARVPQQVDPDYRARGKAMIAASRRHTLKHGGDGLQFIPLDPPADKRLADVQIPVLVIIGELDMPSELKTALRLESGIVGAKRLMIPGTAHLPNLEKPAEYNRALTEFLASLPAG